MISAIFLFIFINHFLNIGYEHDSYLKIQAIKKHFGQASHSFEDSALPQVFPFGHNSFHCGVIEFHSFRNSIITLLIFVFILRVYFSINISAVKSWQCVQNKVVLQCRPILHESNTSTCQIALSLIVTNMPYQGTFYFLLLKSVHVKNM